MDKDIQAFKERAQPDDVWEYKGMTLFLIRRGYDLPSEDEWPADWDKLSPSLKFLAQGHYNGYAISTISVPENQIDDLPVHGGVTLVIRGDSETLYGFDTAHADDFEQPKPKGWVIDETAKLADSLLEWANKE